MLWTTFSEAAGLASICCWLCAQLPQVIENIKRQSSDGLALPFLLNWLLGDITNLVGCILTRQLLFQTILASYFVIVDMVLFIQYFYYGSSLIKAPKSSSPPLLESSPVQQYGAYTTRIPLEHEHHYRELSSAATDVAIAAALAASEEELLNHTRPHMRSVSKRHSIIPSTIGGAADEADDVVDEDALAALADSFYSDASRKHVSWSRERSAAAAAAVAVGKSRSRTRSNASACPALPPIASTPIQSMFPDPDARPEAGHGKEKDPMTVDAQSAVTAPATSARGRPRQRQIDDPPFSQAEDLEVQDTIWKRSGSRSTVRAQQNSRHRNASLVFLGAWALFGIGALSGSKYSMTSRPLSNGSGKGVVLTTIPEFTTTPLEHTLSLPHNYPAAANNDPFSVSMPAFFSAESQSTEKPSSERIIGRFFAWLCTTLYLTSRLPQIWKNFRRKSVEGLTMYLFVFAFLGNVFYVTSILTSPQMYKSRKAVMAFLLESFPYLLGSGGTLLFDVTIVMQSFIYKGRPPIQPHASTHIHPHIHIHPQSRSRVNSYSHRCIHTPLACTPGHVHGGMGLGQCGIGGGGTAMAPTGEMSALSRTRSLSLSDPRRSVYTTPLSHAHGHGQAHGYGHAPSYSTVERYYVNPPASRISRSRSAPHVPEEERLSLLSSVAGASSRTSDERKVDEDRGGKIEDADGDGWMGGERQLWPRC